VKLNHVGARRTTAVHRLVALVFCEGEGEVVRHLDGDKTNNAATNLAWGSYADNEADKVGHGTVPASKRTHCPQGHAYDEANTRVNARGWRRCRRCSTYAARKSRAAVDTYESQTGGTDGAS
jgi:hypothetical protein